MYNGLRSVSTRLTISGSALPWALAAERAYIRTPGSDAILACAVTLLAIVVLIKGLANDAFACAVTLLDIAVFMVPGLRIFDWAVSRPAIKALDVMGFSSLPCAVDLPYNTIPPCPRPLAWAADFDSNAEVMVGDNLILDWAQSFPDSAEINTNVVRR